MSSHKWSAGYWAALDDVLNMINGMTTEDDITQDQMRRKIYGEVMSMSPKIRKNSGSKA